MASRHIYLIASILVYIILAGVAFHAASEQDDKDKNKKNMYQATAYLAIIVVVYHFAKILGFGDAHFEGMKGSSFSSMMSNGLVPMIVGSIALLATITFST